MINRNALIMGKNCIREVLDKEPGKIRKVYTIESNNSDSLYQELLHHRIPIEHTNKQDLSQLVNSTSHQNYVAELKQREFQDAHSFLESISEKSTSLVLMLDSIFDPHNFGAILRAAECFGVEGVVYSKNRGADLTPVVSKVSSGASELVPLIKVSNLAETVKLFKEHYFSVVSAHLEENSKSLYEFDFSERTLLILGSEGSGVQPLLRKKSDYTVQIPMLGKIDSLNVSQAAAVFLYSFRSKHH